MQAIPALWDMSLVRNCLQTSRRGADDVGLSTVGLRLLEMSSDRRVALTAFSRPVPILISSRRHPNVIGGVIAAMRRFRGRETKAQPLP
jgi:hypothetical protein